MYNAVMMAGNSTSTTSSASTIVNTLGFFNLVFVGSVVIGAISALLIAFIMKRQAAYKNENTEQASTTVTIRSAILTVKSVKKSLAN